MQSQTNPTQPGAVTPTASPTSHAHSHMASAGGATLRRLTTEQFAAGLGLAAQSIRKRFCQTGSYYGIVPLKLPNGRLMWPAGALEALMEPSGGL
ncbi:MAG: hypothetical protein J0M19_14040 [Sphingomonadales bacterium]|nr:hypothetical protein [Sphingomonadales bacterium]